MTAESNVGARIFLIGKDATLLGIKEITAAMAKMNAEIAAGGKASAAGGAAAAGITDTEAALKRTAAQQAAVSKVGKAAFLGLTAATAAWGYESVKWAQSYQTQLTRLRTQAGLTVTAMNAIGQAAMKNSAGLQTTPTAYLEAAYHPASTGMSTAETIAITNYAAKEAAISGAPLEDTTNSITSIMKSYGMGAGQAGNTAATLNAVVGAGNMRFADLNNTLASGIAATSKTFGVSLQSMGGALAFMTDRGVPAAQAGQHLRMSEALLGAPSQIATKILTAAGLSSTNAQDATNTMAQTIKAAGVTTTQLSSALRNNSGAGGIYNALQLLHQHLAGSGMSPEMQAAAISRSFGGGRMGTTIEMMYNDLPQLASKTGQIKQNGTTSKFNQDWIAENKTLDAQLKSLKGAVETLGTSFGLTLIPPLTETVKVMASITGWFSRNKAAAYALGGVITAVLAPAMGVYLYGAFLKNGKAIRTVIDGYASLVKKILQHFGLLATDDAALVANDGALAVNDRALETNAGLRSTGSKAGLFSKVGLGGGALGEAASALAVPAALLGAGALGWYEIDSMSQAARKKGLTNPKTGQVFGRNSATDPTGTVKPTASLGGYSANGLQNSQDPSFAPSWANQLQPKNYSGPLTDLQQHQLEQPGGSGKPIVVQSHVYIDGKEVTKAVTKNVKATTARSGG